MEQLKIPLHVGIIMDGNGRWANQKGKERSFGHKQGSANVERVISYGFNRGIKCISLYAFSTENFARPKKEIDTLMSLLGKYLKKLTSKAVKNEIKVRVIGDLTPLSDDLKEIIATETAKTQAFTQKVLNICINYGGRQEIVKAVKELNALGEEITPETIESKLYTAENPPLDLIIRTGGELRISNFLLYQSAYAELYFTQVLWPDFDEEELEKAIVDFSSRQRRFGKVIDAPVKA